MNEEVIMIYITEDGVEYEADSAKDLVRQMREDSFMEGGNATDEEFMEETAECVKLHRHDAIIVTTDADCFVASLLAFGLLEKEDE